MHAHRFVQAPKTLPPTEVVTDTERGISRYLIDELNWNGVTLIPKYIQPSQLGQVHGGVSPARGGYVVWLGRIERGRPQARSIANFTNTWCVGGHRKVPVRGQQEIGSFAVSGH